MVQSCAVPGCVHTKKEQRKGVLSYHRFPVDRWALCKQWLDAIGNPLYNEETDKNELRRRRVCSSHFTKDDFHRNLMAELMDQGKQRKAKTLLNELAVPSVFPGRTRPSTHSTEVSMERDGCLISMPSASSADLPPDKRRRRESSEYLPDTRTVSIKPEYLPDTEVPPEQQMISSCLIKTEPEIPHIKEEEEELLIKPEEADRSTSPLPAVTCKDDEDNGETEPPADTSTEHVRTEASVEYCVPYSDEELGSVCGKDIRKRSLKAHMRVHSAEKPFVCTFCGVSLTVMSELKRHMETHVGQKLYRCGKCGKGFTDTNLLQEHMSTHIVSGPQPRPSPEKTPLVNSSQPIQSSVQSHAVEKPFKCAFCGECFIMTCDLKLHMMTHIGQRLFRCAVCGKGFTQGFIEEHMRTHVGYSM